MTGWLRRLLGGEPGTRGNAAPAAEAAQPFIINLFDDRVVVHRPDGQREEVEWQRLSRVVVRATSRGPWAGKAWLILIGDDGADGRQQGCVAPLDAMNHEALVERLAALPGFDRAPLDRAARAARTGKDRDDALCWQRGAGTDSMAHDDGEAGHERDAS